MVPVARRNLFAEKGRFAISVAGVAFAVLLILIVLALYRGFSHTGETFQQLPGDLWVVQSGTTDPFHSSSLLRQTDLDGLDDVDGVTAVVPVLSRQMGLDVDGGEESARLLALDVPAGLPVPDEIRDRYLPPEGTLVLDGTLVRKTGLDDGDRIELNGRTLTVQGSGERGEAFSPFAFLNFQDAIRVFGVAGIVNYGMVILEPGARPEQVQEDIAAAAPTLRVYTTDSFATAVRKEIDESFLPIITVLLAIGFIVGAAVVGLTIYTATIERTREFGVMKAVGGSGGFLYRIVLSQSAMLTAAGFIAGLGAAVFVAWLAERAVPDFVTDFQVYDVIAVLAAAGGMAVVASFVPIRRLVGIDPASIFRA
jgi:putative ABC transport system permease protein